MAPADPLYCILMALALPPGPSVVLLLLALLMVGRPRARAVFLALGLGSLYLSSIPATVDWLRGQLEIYPPAPLERSAAEAIVVLGAGRRVGAPEYGGADTVIGLGLERLRYAAWLHKKTGLPVLASGGSPLGETLPEAELMRAALKEFGVETRWTETESRNTFENAAFSSRLLKGVGVGEILLVTHAWHMPRAVEAFQQAGLRVVPAPTAGKGAGRGGEAGWCPLDWLPGPSALQMSYFALHEMLGQLWYRYRYYAAAE